MKNALLLFFLFCGGMAFAQNVAGAGAMSAQPLPIVFPSHLEHASQMPLAHEQSILVDSINVSGHGERPLWEFASKTVEIPLGDIARQIRRDRLVARKSSTVFENQ